METWTVITVVIMFGLSVWWARTIRNAVKKADTLFSALYDSALHNLQITERVGVVDMCLGVLRNPDTRRELLAVADSLRPHFPDCQIDINLLGPEDDTRICAAVDELVPIDPVVPCVDSFCLWTLTSGKMHQVTDSRKDPRLRISPYVDQVRSYLGSPFTVHSQDVGVVCAYHPKPRAAWTKEEQKLLQDAAISVSDVFEKALGI